MKSTFPFISAHLAYRAEGRPVNMRGRRGFSLIEMMVVVVIISISAAIAVPGVSKRMKSNRTKITAEQIALIYRQARVRSLGRNSAVLVRFDSGDFTVREGIQGIAATSAGCAQLPESSCLLPNTRWTNDDRSQIISEVDLAASGDFTLALTPASGTTTTAYDVCFTPSGRTYERTVFANPLTPMVGTFRVDVDRTDDVGFARSVLVSQSGVAKVVASP